MNVGLYSGAAGMRVGQDYQQLITENLSLQSVPGYKQVLPVFSTDPTVPATGTQSGASGNPAAVTMSRVIDFSQGPLQPSGSPYHVAIQGQAFFAVREADGSTSYTRNGSFSLSPQGQLLTSDGASVLGSGGSAITLSTTGGAPVIAADGSISIDGAAHGKLDLVHFDNPSASLQPGSYGRYVAADDNAALPGAAKGDTIAQGSLEQSNGNPVEQMANMIQAVRLYEANQKSIQAVDDNTNQLITNLGAHAQG